MEQATLMTEIQRIGHRRHDLGDVWFWHALRVALANQPTCVCAVDVVHRDPQPPVEFATIENAHDMRVPQRRCQLSLAGEPRPELLVGGCGRGQDLQRVLTRQSWVLGEVDLAHTTSSE